MVAPGKYVPKPDAERKQRGPKYRGEAGRWVGCHWFPDLQLLPLSARIMPETRPDEEIASHAWGCSCSICARPGAAAIKRRALRAAARAQAAARRT